ncbi:MAG: glycosyl transferase [Proteobacteria bacterium]|nr:glycosyl transferase [Pseudomonadota bacterium]
MSIQSLAYDTKQPCTQRTAEQEAKSQHPAPIVNYAWEIRLTQMLLAFTFLAWCMVSAQTGSILWQRIQMGNPGPILEQILFIIIIQGLIYGNFVYQLTRIGYLRRRLKHKPATPEEREALYDGEAPTLAILVPSYKEELAVVRRTLISAGLQDYPAKRVVLLVDDPVAPNNPWDQRALEATRNLPVQLQALFDKAAMPFIRAQSDFLFRLKQNRMDLSAETIRLAGLYEEAAAWIEAYAQACPQADQGDQMLLDRVLNRAAYAHLDRARQLRASVGAVPLSRVQREYKRLAALFSVEFTSFERKRYVNLSHESNKAMNLNSYIRLLGRSWQVVNRPDGNYLEEAQPGEAALKVPAADFLITLDADSLLVPEYALVLVHHMRQPGNERLAVAQTPYNTIPNPANHLEHISGATTDIQYLIHQGFTHYGATYWVGANALLRTPALADIKTISRERGFEMPVYIQDRTVIEDTESSIDLMACGWKLYNYPERLAYSATPPDFGSLLIQRRRWANGGLIILPKLLRYLVRRPSLAKIREGFFRVHYLSSIALVNAGLLILFSHSFEESIEGAWLPLGALPYFILYARDLRYNGYRMRDLVSVYALNLLLVPVNMGGVLKSLHQGIAGHKIPFGRTPKISGRTSIPALYCFAELALPVYCLGACAWDVWHARWAHAAFALFNGALFFYGLFRLIGIKDMLRDMLAGWNVRKAIATPVAVLPVLVEAGEAAFAHRPNGAMKKFRVG